MNYMAQESQFNSQKTKETRNVMIVERKGTGHEIVPQEIGAIVATNVDKKDICKLNVPIRIARVVDLATEELVTKNLAQTLNLNQLVNKAPKPQRSILEI